MTDKEKKAFLGRYRQIAAEEAAIWEEVSYWVSRSCLEETATLADFLAKTVCRKETAGRGVTGQGIENRKETGGQTIRQEGAAQIESPARSRSRTPKAHRRRVRKQLSGGRRVRSKKRGQG